MISGNPLLHLSHWYYETLFENWMIQSYNIVTRTTTNITMLVCVCQFRIMIPSKIEYSAPMTTNIIEPTNLIFVINFHISFGFFPTFFWWYLLNAQFCCLFPSAYYLIYWLKYIYDWLNNKFTLMYMKLHKNRKK